jgi:hypothetical protein
MNEVAIMILKRSIWLWVGTALVITLNTVAAMVGGVTLVYATLIITGLFALVGIGFGLWVGRTLAKSTLQLSPAARP